MRHTTSFTPPKVLSNVSQEGPSVMDTATAPTAATNPTAAPMFVPITPLTDVNSTGQRFVCVFSTPFFHFCVCFSNFAKIS